ncbi:MAG TPA: hypothetical protein VFT72_20505 [Opitutaceae bacterium]|nr:hypothetical protein [Opitutaceae bacterium]
MTFQFFPRSIFLWCAALVLASGICARAEFTVSGRTILKDGAPFLIKGVCYNPTPIGENGSRSPNGDYYTSGYSAIWDRDLPRLRAMGANVIRIYGWNPTADHTAFLDRCYNNGDHPIFVLVNYWVDPSSDWTNANTVKSITSNFTNIEERLGSHPAVLALIVGNEVNAQNSNGSKASFWSAMNSVAGSIKALNSKRLVSVAITDSISQLGSANSAMTRIDFWCMQIYRGTSFGSFFSEYSSRSTRPVVISEYGVDNYDHKTGGEYSGGGAYSGDIVSNLWIEIVKSSAVCAGGCVFEFCDEWFRAPSGSDTTQDAGGWTASGFPDGVADEEWFGLFSIAKSSSGPNVISPRAGYSELSALWNSTPTTSDPATPEPPESSSASASSMGFETPNVGTNNANAYVYAPTVSGWSFVGSSGVAGNNSAFTSGNPNAPEGTQVGFVQKNGSVSLQLNLSAGSYSVAAMTANRANRGYKQTVGVLVDGAEVGRFTGGTSYQLSTTSVFTVTAGVHEIRFVGQTTVDATLFLDQIKVAPATVAAPAVVVPMGNIGFENPAVGSNLTSAYKYAPATVIGVQDWVFSGSSGVAGNGSAFTKGNSVAPEGTQVAFLQQATSVISQSVTLPGTGNYTFAVSAAQRGNKTQSKQVVQVYLDSTLIGSISPSGIAYETISLSFAASSGAHVLSLHGTNPTDSTAFIDKVRLTSAP